MILSRENHKNDCDKYVVEKKETISKPLTDKKIINIKSSVQILISASEIKQNKNSTERAQSQENELNKKTNKSRFHLHEGSGK